MWELQDGHLSSFFEIQTVFRAVYRYRSEEEEKIVWTESKKS